MMLKDYFGLGIHGEGVDLVIAADDIVTLDTDGTKTTLLVLSVINNINNKTDGTILLTPHKGSHHRIKLEVTDFINKFWVANPELFKDAEKVIYTFGESKKYLENRAAKSANHQYKLYDNCHYRFSIGDSIGVVCGKKSVYGVLKRLEVKYDEENDKNIITIDISTDHGVTTIIKSCVASTEKRKYNTDGIFIGTAMHLNIKLA